MVIKIQALILKFLINDELSWLKVCLEIDFFLGIWEPCRIGIQNDVIIWGGEFNYRSATDRRVAHDKDA